MTDEELSNLIKAGAANALLRFKKQVIEHSKAGDIEHNVNIVEGLVVVEFLSGALQAAWFLCKEDGDITPQQMQRVVMELGKELGLESAYAKL